MDEVAGLRTKKDSLSDLGYCHGTSEDFCTTLLGMALQMSPDLARTFVAQVVRSAPSAAGWEPVDHIAVSGQESLEPHLPGCGRYPDLWLRCYSRTNPTPYLILLEVKVASGESTDQMTHYRHFVDQVRGGNCPAFRSGVLAFLSFQAAPALSADPDAVLTWDCIIKMFEAHSSRVEGFEKRFVDGICDHFIHVKEKYMGRPPLGTAEEFLTMLREVPARFAWLRYEAPRPGGLQHALAPDLAHPWVSSRVGPVKPKELALVRIDPHRAPHLNSFPESWLRMLLPKTANAKDWHRRIQKVKENLPELRQAVEEVLSAMDLCRRQESP